MNERIEHITKQVDEYFDDLSIEFSRQSWMEKFAELIWEEAYQQGHDDGWEEAILKERG